MYGHAFGRVCCADTRCAGMCVRACSEVSTHGRLSSEVSAVCCTRGTLGTPGTRRPLGATCKWDGGVRCPRRCGRCWHSGAQVRRALNDDGARRTVKLVRFPGKGPCDKTVGRLSKRAWHGGKPCPGTATDWVTRGHLCQQSSVWYVTDLTLAWWLNVQSNQHEPLRLGAPRG